MGGKRFKYLTRYLSEQGIACTVLTVRPESTDYLDPSLDTGHATVHQIRGLPPYPVPVAGRPGEFLTRAWAKWFCTIDPHSGWILPTVRKGLSLARSEGINRIIATGPPFSSMVAAHLIARSTGIPLVLDYRDPWTSHPRPFPMPLGPMVNRALERIITRRAAATVHVSTAMVSQFLASFPRFPEGNCHLVTNGFEPQWDRIPRPLGRNDKKKIVYAGSFYGDRSVRLILEPLLDLMNDGAIGRDSIEVHVFGSVRAADRAFIAEANAAELVIEHDFTPLQDLLEYMRAADVLYLCSGRDVGYALPYKFFDYLSVRRPILAVAPPDSELTAVMREVDCGEAASMDRPEEIRRSILALLGSSRRPDPTFANADRFTWERCARRYAEVLRDLDGPRT